MRKVIAIDFDGCLCSNAYPHIGKPNWRVIAEALIAQKSGAALILWTCREGSRRPPPPVGPAVRRRKREPAGMGHRLWYRSPQGGGKRILGRQGGEQSPRTG